VKISVSFVLSCRSWALRDASWRHAAIHLHLPCDMHVTWFWFHGLLCVLSLALHPQCLLLLVDAHARVVGHIRGVCWSWHLHWTWLTRYFWWLGTLTLVSTSLSYSHLILLRIMLALTKLESHIWVKVASWVHIS
jgi:hypothetical protein